MKRSALFAAAGVVGLALGVAGTADARPLTLGSSVEGEITDRDAASADGVRYDEYVLSLAAGQAALITLTSQAFDSVLEVGAGRGAAFEAITGDDDSGGEGNARLRFRAPEAGQYVVRARPFDAAMRGGYTLTTLERKPAPPAVAEEISFGAPLTGALAEGGPRTEEDDRLFQLYAFDGRAGQRIKVDMRSDTLDSYLEIGGAQGAFEPLASDDDGGGDLNARLLFVIPDDGRYLIRAGALDPVSEGGFTLGVEELPEPARTARVVQLRKGGPIAAELLGTDAAKDDFQFYDLYRIRGRAGDTVTVTMRSEAFDSFLEGGAPSPVGFAVAVEDDDSGGGYDAQLTLTFERTGDAFVRAMALGLGSTGPYTLEVE